MICSHYVLCVRTYMHVIIINVECRTKYDIVSYSLDDYRLGIYILL